MADNAQTPAPGTHPDAVVINDDGSVTAHGRKAWVWVHDESTGARYDVPATMLPRAGLRVVTGYPVNTKPHARTAKTAVVLGGVPAPAAPVVAEEATSEAGATPATEPAGADAGEPAEGAGDAGDAATSTTSTKVRRPAR